MERDSGPWGDLLGFGPRGLDWWFEQLDHLGNLGETLGKMNCCQLDASNLVIQTTKWIFVGKLRIIYEKQIIQTSISDALTLYVKGLVVLHLFQYVFPSSLNFPVV